MGPPWSKRQNGYIFTSNGNSDSLLFEPHGDTSNDLAKYCADYKVTQAILPMTTQDLTIPPYPLVPGKIDDILAKVPSINTIYDLPNGNIEQKGVLAQYLKEGKVELKTEGIKIVKMLKY